MLGMLSEYSCWENPKLLCFLGYKVWAKRFPSSGEASRASCWDHRQGVLSLGVCVAPGDPSVSSYRLGGAEPEITSRVLQKLLETMFVLYVLIIGVYSFTVQPEEHTGEKWIFQLERACLKLLWGKAVVYLVKSIVFKRQVVTDASSCPSPLLHCACSGHRSFLPKSEPRRWCICPQEKVPLDFNHMSCHN